jgi:hypothetical protein
VGVAIAAIGVALVLALVAYFYRRKVEAKDPLGGDKAIPFLPNGHLSEVAVPMATPVNDSLSFKVFISHHQQESVTEVEVLKKVLCKKGVVVTTTDDIIVRERSTDEHEKELEEAGLFVIMGTKRYGKDVAGMLHNKEIKLIVHSQKPFFLINMNPRKSLMEFEEPSTNLLFSLNTTSWERWELGTPMNEALPGKLLEKLGEGRRKVTCHGVARPSKLSPPSQAPVTCVGGMPRCAGVLRDLAMRAKWAQ